MSPLATARRGRSVWLRVGLAATAALALAVLTSVLELPSVGAGRPHRPRRGRLQAGRDPRTAPARGAVRAGPRRARTRDGHRRPRTRTCDQRGPANRRRPAREGRSAAEDVGPPTVGRRPAWHLEEPRRPDPRQPGRRRAHDRSRTHSPVRSRGFSADPTRRRRVRRRPTWGGIRTRDPRVMRPRRSDSSSGEATSAAPVSRQKAETNPCLTAPS